MPPPSPRPAALTDLDATYHTRVDELAITASRLSRAVPAFLTLALTLVLVAHVAHLRALRPASASKLRPTTRPMRLAADNAPPRAPSLPPVTPRAPSAAARTRYAKLAALYLAPFAAPRPPCNLTAALASCTSCALLQAVSGALHVHDPHLLRAALPFRELRLREAVFFARRFVASRPDADFEVLLSVADGVPFTAKTHEYRMPPPDGALGGCAVLSASRCNVSHALGFPVGLADALRRAFPERYWRRESGILGEWDAAVARFGAVEVPWNEKVGRAVFRGAVRQSAAVRGEEASGAECDAAGRTGLWKRAREHAAEAERAALAAAGRRATWPVPARWLRRRAAPLLDVQVAGVCGRRIYASDGLGLEAQGRFKYVVHAAGNSFWADRLLLLLFGSSAVLRQETPCGMFFEPLLEAYREYVPVDFWFRQLVRQTMWARQNDAKVAQIVRNARAFAQEYLSLAGVQAYVDELLGQYAGLFADREVRLRQGGVQVFP